jgi:hypothetical protein
MGLSLYQMDVSNVLLNTVIEEEAYIKQPQGFEVHQKDTHVCRWKNLYGEPLMYKKSIVKNSYDRGSISKWFFRSLG